MEQAASLGCPPAAVEAHQSGREGRSARCLGPEKVEAHGEMAEEGLVDRYA